MTTQSGSRIWKFSRSHDQAYIDCPYYYYMQYQYGGKGLVPVKLDIGQSTGTLSHEILSEVLKYAKEHKIPPPGGFVDEVCAKAVKSYREMVERRGLSEVSGTLELEIQRQSALAEGLARVWTLYRLPYILDEFEIVASEEEHEIEFGPGQILMSRIDGVLRRKMDGELFAGPEFKTTGWINDDYVESWRYSVQTLSHSLDVVKKYGQEPAGVMMEFLYKGFRKKDNDGVYVYYSPLVRGYRMKGEFGDMTYGFDSSLARKKDWEVFDTYAMGMGNWVQLLPEEVVGQMLYSTTIYRSPTELEEWKLQVSLRQSKIQAALIMLNEMEPTEAAASEIMAQVFPKRLDRYCFSNQYKKKCVYCDVCYRKVDDPATCGLYMVREPHHANEFEDE